MLMDDCKGSLRLDWGGGRRRDKGKEGRNNCQKLKHCSTSLAYNEVHAITFPLFHSSKSGKINKQR